MINFTISSPYSCKFDRFRKLKFYYNFIGNQFHKMQSIKCRIYLVRNRCQDFILLFFRCKFHNKAQVLLQIYLIPLTESQISLASFNFHFLQAILSAKVSGNIRNSAIACKTLLELAIAKRNESRSRFTAFVEMHKVLQWCLNLFICSSALLVAL